MGKPTTPEELKYCVDSIHNLTVTFKRMHRRILTNRGQKPKQQEFIALLAIDTEFWAQSSGICSP